MSLEQKIEDLTQAIVGLIHVLQERPTTLQQPVQAAPAPAPVPAPIPPAPAPVQAVPVVSAPVVASPSSMPAPPTFVAPVATTPVGGVPFSDQKGLIDYVIGSYCALGAQKGAQIQQVLVNLGCTNINDVKPEQYAALFAGVEALKG